MWYLQGFPQNLLKPIVSLKLYCGQEGNKSHTVPLKNPHRVFLFGNGYLAETTLGFLPVLKSLFL